MVYNIILSEVQVFPVWDSILPFLVVVRLRNRSLTLSLSLSVDSPRFVVERKRFCRFFLIQRMETVLPPIARGIRVSIEARY